MRMHGGPATAVCDHGLRVPGVAPASPPTVTGFLGGRGGSQCRVTPTSDRFRRFAPRWTRRSDRPSLPLPPPPPPPPRFLLGSGVPPLGPTGGPLRSGRWHLFRQRRLGQRSSVLSTSATTFSLMSVLELAPGPHSTTTP